MDADARQRLADLLDERQGELSQLPVLTGFDGFLDELVTIVAERTGPGAAWRPMTAMADFGAAITAAAGQSSLREMVVRGTEPGGCAINTADGLTTLGLPVRYCGTVGEPPDAAFLPILDRCQDWRSLDLPPGRTLACEFADGKYMLSATSHLADLTPTTIEAHADWLARAVTDARVILHVNWSLYPHMTAVWEHLRRHVYADLKQRPWFLFDLVDPRSRSRNDLRSAMDTIAGFESCGRCCFGGNVNEANAVGALFGLPSIDGHGSELTQRAAELRTLLGISAVCLHSIRSASWADAEHTCRIEGPYTAKPVKSTGAGDRFHAGVAAALALELAPQEALALGCACSGHFVRTATSASISQVCAMLADHGSWPV